MSYAEYAKKKYQNYKDLGWKMGDFWEDVSGITFNSTDLVGVKRKHSFNDAGILVETGHFDVPKYKPTPKQEVKVEPQPAPTVSEVISEPVVVESEKESVTETKPKKKKGK